MDEKNTTKHTVNPWIITATLVVIVGVAAFFAGTKYQQGRIPTRQFGNGQFQAFQGRNGQGGSQGNRQAGLRPVTGEVLSVDDKSMTVKMTDGSTKIVLFSETTIYNKSSEGSQSDIKAGEQVATFGTENTDGSVTAQSVQLNPVFRTETQPSGASPTTTN